MSTSRVVICFFWLFAAGVSVVTAAEPGYKEWYRRGIEQNRKGELENAIASYSKAIAAKPDSAALFFVRGRAYLQNDQFDSAIRDLTKAIALKPGYAEAYNIRGVSYAGKGESKAAKADFAKACTLGLSDACKNNK